MRYRVETTAPEALKALPFVWEVEPDKDGDIYTVYAERDRAGELSAVPGVTSVKVLGYTTVIEISASPEAEARLRELWEKSPDFLKKTLGIIHINFGD